LAPTRVREGEEYLKRGPCRTRKMERAVGALLIDGERELGSVRETGERQGERKIGVGSGIECGDTHVHIRVAVCQYSGLRFHIRFSII
jgi:hypothetical protein